MFDFLFNYPLSTWEGARVSFSTAWPWWLIGLALLLGLLCVSAALLRLPVSKGRRITVGIIQSVLLALVMLMLLRPVLLVDEVRRDDNVVAVVIDSSNSMGFPASNDSSNSRFDAAQAAFDDVRSELENTFETRLYTLGDQLKPAIDNETLTLAGARTDLAGGLRELLDQSSADELAAVVLLSDGGNNAETMDVEWWNRLRQAEVPVHTVGVGPEQVAGDFELADVFLPTHFPPNTTVTARARIKHPGNATNVRLRVKQGNALRYASTVALQSGASETTHEFSFPSGDEGVQSLQFEVLPDADDKNSVNNVVQRVMNVNHAPKRILYVEGEPRWEYKFLRRAVANDASIDIVSLLRTSPNKFYRQGVSSSRELENGFPLTRENLFGYDAIIIGSLEAAELSVEQQANVRDFVAERGGALLMLGGTSGLSDGGWGRSAVQAALPVQLETDSGSLNNTFQRERVQVELTDFGKRAEWLKLPSPADAPRFDGEGSTEGLGREDDAWASLPELADIQRLGKPKAGAQVMMQTAQSKEPVLVWHRYGKGRSYVLATSGTWRWQMSLPSEDQRHETFWQNLTAELTANVTTRLSIDAGPAVQRDRKAAAVDVVALAQDFTAYQASDIVAVLTTPDGARRDVSLVPDINFPGRFLVNVDYESVGPHAISIELQDAEDALEVNVHQDQARAETWWMVENNTAEYFSPELQSGVLQRIADESGGSFRLLSAMNQLPSALLAKNNALTLQNELPLWNMPVLFLLLILGKLFEWLLRLRWKRL